MTHFRKDLDLQPPLLLERVRRRRKFTALVSLCKVTLLQRCPNCGPGAVCGPLDEFCNSNLALRSFFNFLRMRFKVATFSKTENVVIC